MELKDTNDQNGAWDWMTIGTAVALVVAAALLILVLLPQATSNDLSVDGGPTATSHPTSDRS
jgi:preprotein translocase subunit SecG